jgi:hypothetical protein
MGSPVQRLLQLLEQSGVLVKASSVMTEQLKYQRLQETLMLLHGCCCCLCRPGLPQTGIANIQRTAKHLVCQQQPLCISLVHETAAEVRRG